MRSVGILRTQRLRAPGVEPGRHEVMSLAWNRATRPQRPRWESNPTTQTFVASGVHPVHSWPMDSPSGVEPDVHAFGGRELVPPATARWVFTPRVARGSRRIEVAGVAATRERRDVARSRTEVRGFADRVDHWISTSGCRLVTPSLNASRRPGSRPPTSRGGAVTGNRTRIAGLADQHSTFEL
jgi:hypothetical protein